eukprot:869149-Prorocentrum_lima.AAC.1
MAGSQALSVGNQAMPPEPSSCTPRSQDVSAEIASASEPAGQEYGQWNATMSREFKQFLYSWSRW